MRIAQIIPSLKPAGPVNVALDLTALLREKGHEVEVFYFDDKADAVALSNAKKIKFWHKRNWNDFDVVHSHGFRPDVYLSRNAGTMPATVSTLHNYLKNDLRYTYNALVAAVFAPVWNAACRKHDANVVLSNDMLQYYRQFWKNKSLHVIPNTRLISSEKSPERQAEIKKLAGNKNIIGSVSTVTGIKGLEQLVQFVSRHPNWIYVHIGGGQLDKLKSLAQELDVTNRCHFLGHQAAGWQYAKAFDIFALPSRSEGFPLSLLEAVQLQVPVITSDLPVFQELFHHSEIARFKLDDPLSFDRAVEQTMENATERSRKALQHFEKYYHPQRILNLYLELYQSLQ